MLYLVVGLGLFQGIVGVPSMIGLLIGLLVLLIAIYIVFLIVGALNLPSPVNNIITAVVGLILLVILLRYLGLL